MTDRILWATVVARAACSTSGLSPDDWYPVSAPAEAARREAAGAIAVCAACRVREECLELALRNWTVGQHGVWGGTVPAERDGTPRRAGRAAHPGAGQEPGRRPGSVLTCTLRCGTTQAQSATLPTPEPKPAADARRIGDGEPAGTAGRRRPGMAKNIRTATRARPDPPTRVDGQASTWRSDRRHRPDEELVSGLKPGAYATGTMKGRTWNLTSAGSSSGITGRAFSATPGASTAPP